MESSSLPRSSNWAATVETIFGCGALSSGRFGVERVAGGFKRVAKSAAVTADAELWLVLAVAFTGAETGGKRATNAEYWFISATEASSRVRMF